MVYESVSEVVQVALEVSTQVDAAEVDLRGPPGVVPDPALETETLPEGLLPEGLPEAELEEDQTAELALQVGCEVEVEVQPAEATDECDEGAAEEVHAGIDEDDHGEVSWADDQEAAELVDLAEDSEAE